MDDLLPLRGKQGKDDGVEANVNTEHIPGWPFRQAVQITQSSYSALSSINEDNLPFRLLIAPQYL